jgi:hypothetical protein
MLNESKFSDILRGKIMHTTVHIFNIRLIRINNDKNPYDLWKGRSTNVKHFRVFGRKCYIKREDKKIGKFDPSIE